MIQAIAIKELRETGWMAALALVPLGVLVRERIGTAAAVPFLNDGFLESWSGTAWLLAIALGLRQSAWESVRGTYPFLLHRPATRSAILAGKIAVGLVLLQATAALPIVWYGLWADAPGTHAGPFRWSMTEPDWCVWLSLPVAYLTAFLSGLLPARWIGTKLMPAIAGSLFVLLVTQGRNWQIGIGENPWLALDRLTQALPVVLVVCLTAGTALTALVFRTAAQRDFG
jgi:hypothetical protein